MDKVLLLETFKTICSQLADLTIKIDEPNWGKSFFSPALAILQDENLSVDERLKKAYDRTGVFGGMGSWLDCPPYSAYRVGLTQQYDELTEELWECRMAVVAKKDS